MEIIYQPNPLQCGLACVEMISHHLGKGEKFKNSLMVDQMKKYNGLSVLELTNLGRNLGIEFTSFRCNLEDIKAIQEEYFLLLLFGNHYVIAENTIEGLKLFDPLRGKVNLKYTLMPARNNYIVIFFKLLF